MWFRPGTQSVRLSLGLAVTLVSTAGCAPVPDQAKYSVDEYRKDAELRRSEFARCANDPGSRMNSPDCVNAREAERLAGVGSLRSLAPLELPNPPRADTDSRSQREPSRN